MQVRIIESDNYGVTAVFQSEDQSVATDFIRHGPSGSYRPVQEISDEQFERVRTEVNTDHFPVVNELIDFGTGALRGYTEYCSKCDTTMLETDKDRDTEETSSKIITTHLECPQCGHTLTAHRHQPS